MTARDRKIPASLAWQRDYLLMALADDGAVGVDFEFVGAPTEPPWRILADQERTALKAFPDQAARHLAFLHLWTAKEAVLKALGTGFARDPSTVTIIGDGDALSVAVDGAPLALRATAGGIHGSGSDRLVWRAVLL